MRVLCAVEQHFEFRVDRHIYCDGPGLYSSWSNYLEVFDEVVVLARMAPARGSCDPESRADGPGVAFCALPDYHGPWEYLRKYSELQAVVRAAVKSYDAYLLRVPGLVGRLAWHEVRRAGKPFALEVVGDPWDALGPGIWRSAFRPLFRRVAARELRAMCREAMAIHYVTEKALQARYPPGQDAYAVGFSDALIGSAFASAEMMAERRKRLEQRAAAGGERAKPLRIGFVGSLARMYKGPDVLLHAVAACGSRGLDLELVLAGEGRHAAEMKALASRLGMAARTRFAGQLPHGQAIFDFLDAIDLFVMPSRAEGLPRALLEAMARGCPAICSAVGGIPELLPAEDLVPPGDVEALAAKIAAVAGDARRMEQMALRNLERARQFRPELLEETRRSFLVYVKEHSGAVINPQESPDQPPLTRA